MSGNTWIIIGIVAVAISAFSIPYGFYVKSNEEPKSGHTIPKPLLDFTFENKDVPLTIPFQDGSKKLPIRTTLFLRVRVINDNIRLNQIELDFPTRMRTVAIGENSRILVPVFFTTELLISPPEFQWDTTPLITILKHFLAKNNFSITDDTLNLLFDMELPVLASVDYNFLGNPYKLKSIYIIQFDLAVEKKSKKPANYFIDIKNVSLLQNLKDSAINSTDVLNEVFDKSFKSHFLKKVDSKPHGE